MDRKRVVLVYTGCEQGTWGDIAFRREQYYHYLPGILYIAAALRRAELTRDRLEVVTRHYNTTVQTTEEIRDDIIGLKPDALGLACYCWNISLHFNLIDHVKKAIPGVSVFLGGPEVTLKTDDLCREFFEEHPAVDLLVFGEAEQRIPALLDALFDGAFDGLDNMRGYSFHPRFGGHSALSPAPAPMLDDVPEVYPHPIEVKRSPHAGVYAVYEGSRGCPNKCIYCEFVRSRHTQDSYGFSRIERELTWLLEQGVDGIHFADAVFDRDPERAARILRLCIARNRNTTLLSYCSFNTLTPELVSLFEQSQMQIGVGIQSTDHRVLKTIRRAPPTRLFRDAAPLLRGRAVNFYTDLMFGMPDDSMERFRTSFDDTLALQPAFMMLFPLTLVRGTELGDDPGRFGVRPCASEDVARLDLQCDIEYLNLGLSEGFRLEDLETFDDVAVTCFYYYNRFPASLRCLQKRWHGASFDLYRLLGRATKEFLRRTGQQASNTSNLEGFQEKTRAVCTGILRTEGAGPRELAAFDELFKLDLFRLVILRSAHREKTHKRVLAMGLRPDLPNDLENGMRLVKTTFGKTITLNHRLADLRRLHELGENIEDAPGPVLVHAPFGHAGTTIRQIGPPEDLLFDLLTADRGLRVKSIVASLNQRFGAGAGETVFTGALLRELVTPLWEDGAVRVMA
ncbi:MAG: radical SAM protein [Chitinivibrionales bacterium]|nr:radical SAM protein [Chitinivibrionales bacterium]MBD3395952.1 radical SAM protein [Chitinivibrionales bacterium]